MKPSEFQIDCLKYILYGYKDLIRCLDQITYLKVKSIEHTGVGCIYEYTLSNYHRKLNTEDEVISGDQLEAAELPHGATLTLRIANGAIDSLEILAHGTAFPINEPSDYNFVSPPTNLIRD